MPVPEPAPEPPPEYTSFGCTACGTRLGFRVKHVGKKAKCPDCGTVNRIPPPQPKKAPSIPAALSGEQFELWGVDEAPLPAELIARQVELIPVKCRLCSTLMYARVAQLGKQATCPDCGTKTPIVRPKAASVSSPAGVPDGEEYQLDPASAPTARPVPRPIALREAERHEAARKATDQPTKRKRKPRAEARQQPLKFPLLQRLPAMLLASPAPVWWGMLSIGLAVAASFGAWGAGGAESKFHAVAMVCFFVVGCVTGIMWLAAACVLWLAVLTETADGHDRLHNPPSTNFFEWFGETLYLVVPFAASLVPGYAIGRVAAALMPEAAGWQAAFTLAGWLLIFPLAILSALEQGSPFAVFSPKLAKSLFTCLPTWLLFYLETAVLLGVTVAAAAWLFGKSPLVGILAAPLVVGASLMYFRLVGRLAWRLGELISADVDD